VDLSDEVGPSTDGPVVSDHAKVATPTLDDAAEVSCARREHDMDAIDRVDGHPVRLPYDGVDPSPQGAESNPACVYVWHVRTPQPKTSAL
jgi:hypothetical protein